MIDVQHGRQALAPAHSLTQHRQRGWSSLDADLGEFLEVLPAQLQLDGAWYKGTPNAVLQNLDIIHAHAPRHMLVLAGDHIYKMDYATLLAEHVARRADVSIAALRVPIDSASAFGIVTTADDDRITGFVEKPRQPRACVDDPSVAFASMGIYCFETGFLFDLLRSDARSTECSHVRDQLHPRTRRRPVLARRRHAGRILGGQPGLGARAALAGHVRRILACAHTAATTTIGEVHPRQPRRGGPDFQCARFERLHYQRGRSAELGCRVLTAARAGADAR
jgi:hypothetical protein